MEKQIFSFSSLTEEPGLKHVSPDWRVKFEKCGLDPDRCTCLKCAEMHGCQFVFDVSNYGGDCLEDRQIDYCGVKGD